MISEVVSGINTVTSSVLSNFSIANIAAIIGIVIGAVVGLFLFWWGARWVVKRVTGAFKSGKLRL
jgi:ABC-type microcin C transport system permease subunit YejE